MTQGLKRSRIKTTRWLALRGGAKTEGRGLRHLPHALCWATHDDAPPAAPGVEGAPGVKVALDGVHRVTRGSGAREWGTQATASAPACARVGNRAPMLS